MSRDLSSPAANALTVTPSDSAEIPLCRALWIGVGGNVTVVCEDGAASVLFAGAGAGQVIPVRCRKVLSTGTTATSIVALY